MNILNMLPGLLLSATPISELRGGIPVMLASGVGLYTAAILGILSNILIIPLIFLFFDYFHDRFMKIGFYSKLFERKLEKSRIKLNGRFKTWPFVGLWFLVAIPIPGTGVYTAGLLAWFFKFNRRKSFISMALGVVFAGILVSGICAGVVSLIW